MAKGITALLIFQRSRIYHGVWGSAPFQSLYELSSGHWMSLTLMPEWYFLLLFLGLLTTLGASWTPLIWFSPMLAAGVLLTLIQAMPAVFEQLSSGTSFKICRAGMRSLVPLFHLVQPAARLLGRIRHGLGPWNWRDLRPVIPWPTVNSIWSERWEAMKSRLSQIADILGNRCANCSWR